MNNLRFVWDENKNRANQKNIKSLLMKLKLSFMTKMLV